MKEDAKKDLLFQYERLRAEILHNDVIGLQILGATIILVGAIMSFAFKETAHSDLFRIGFHFAALLVAYTGMSQTLARIKNTFQVAAYMREFLEPFSDHIKWETRLQKMRNKGGRKEYIRFSSVITTYLLMGGANTIFTLFYFVRSFSDFAHMPYINLNPILNVIITKVWPSGIVCGLCVYYFIVMCIEYRTKYNLYVKEQGNYFTRQWQSITDVSMWGVTTPPLPAQVKRWWKFFQRSR